MVAIAKELKCALVIAVANEVSKYDPRILPWLATECSSVTECLDSFSTQHSPKKVSRIFNPFFDFRKSMTLGKLYSLIFVNFCRRNIVGFESCSRIAESY
jgi:hypothetical protein